jgi:hypothetical protein
MDVLYQALSQCVSVIELAFFQAPDLSNPSTYYPIIIIFYVRPLDSFSSLIQSCAAISLFGWHTNSDRLAFFPTHFLSHNTIHSTSRALFILPAEHSLSFLESVSLSSSCSHFILVHLVG